MATVGQDFDSYANWMDQNGVDRRHVKTIAESYTAQAFITTDLDDNQITAFHPGAMNLAHENHIADAEGITVGIVAPDGRDAMIQHAKEFAEAGIPFIFDPGQGLPLFDGDDLNTFIDQATYVVVNDYESQLIQDKTGKGITELATKVDAYIETLGGEGSRVHANGEIIDIPAAKIAAAKDPTGCGDAFRAGLLYGLANQMDWPLTGRLASLLGGIKIEHAGTQNHAFTMADIEARFKESFGMSLG
jgi:adenosine kinase